MATRQRGGRIPQPPRRTPTGAPRTAREPGTRAAAAREEGRVAPGETISPMQAWFLAARPKTLAAAFIPVLVGSAAAWADDVFRLLPALAALLGALLIQIGTNLANDYYDFVKGADTERRVGPTRVTQAGLIPPGQVRNAMFLVFALAALVGVYLVLEGGWPIAAIGIASILSGIAYTGGPWPLGYNGLGDLFVFVFFGVVATVGTYWVQAGGASPEVFMASVPIGCLSTAILVVNNIRDAESDRAANKRTLAVRYGVDFARREYLVLLLLAYMTLATLFLAFSNPLVFLPFATVPIAMRLVGSVNRDHGVRLNRTLAQTAQLLAVFGVLLAAGIVLSAWMGGR